MARTGLLCRGGGAGDPGGRYAPHSTARLSGRCAGRVWFVVSAVSAFVPALRLISTEPSCAGAPRTSAWCKCPRRSTLASCSFLEQGRREGLSRQVSAPPGVAPQLNVLGLDNRRNFFTEKDCQALEEAAQGCGGVTVPGGVKGKMT